MQPVYGISGAKILTESILSHLKGYLGAHPVRIGNQAYEHTQHDVYGEMILAIAPLFLDIRFSSQGFSPPYHLLKKLLAMIESCIGAQDASLWEFRDRPRVHTFSQLMHWAGAHQAAEIGRVCGYTDIFELAVRLSKQARRFIETRCWNEELGAYVSGARFKRSRCVTATNDQSRLFTW